MTMLRDVRRGAFEEGRWECAGRYYASPARTCTYKPTHSTGVHTYWAAFVLLVLHRLLITTLTSLWLGKNPDYDGVRWGAMGHDPMIELTGGVDRAGAQ